MNEFVPPQPITPTPRHVLQFLLTIFVWGFGAYMFMVGLTHLSDNFILGLIPTISGFVIAYKSVALMD